MDSFPTQKAKTINTTQFGVDSSGFPSMKTTKNLYNPNTPKIVVSPVVQPKTVLQKIGSGISTMAKNTVAIPSMFRQTLATQESITRANQLQELAKKTGLKQTKDGFVFTNANAQKVLADFAKKQASVGHQADVKAQNLNKTIATLISDMVAYPLTAATKTKPVQTVLKGVEKVGEKVSYPASKLWSVGEGIRTGQSPVKVWNELKKAYEAPVPGYKPSIAQQTALGMEQSITPMAVGAGLSLIPYVGKPLSSLYFAAQSANDELKKTGEMTIPGVTNVAIDTYFDSKIGNVLEGVFKESALGSVKSIKTILSSFGKGGFTEGGTEVVQSLGKFGVDYNSARTTTEKEKVMARAIDYVRNGMIPEFTASFIGGGILTGVAGTVSPTVTQQVQPTVQETVQPVAQEQIQETFPKMVTEPIIQAEEPKPITQTKPTTAEKPFIPVDTTKFNNLTDYLGTVLRTPKLDFTLLPKTLKESILDIYIKNWYETKGIPFNKEEAITTKGNILKSVYGGTGIPQPLVKEALKYDNVNDFIRAQQPTKGYTTVYHRTNADITGDFVSKENTGEAFVSNRETGQAEGYGKNVVVLRVKNSDLRLDDEFPNGEKHYAIPKEAINKYLKNTFQLTDIWNKAHETTQPTQPFTKPSGIGKIIEAKAIESGLTKGFEGTAEFNPTTVKEQAQMIADVMNSNIEMAKKMVKGEEPLLDRMNPAYVVKALTDYAMENRDGQLMKDIANSPLVSETSAAAQTLRLTQEIEPDSATARIREIIKERKTVAEKRLFGRTETQEKNNIRKDLENKISKTKPGKYSWTSLIEEITC